ncbi:MAG: GTP-binding protein, partial [Actinomycetota bacterium]|nr:GTP-binding protein [Actinomycetota bacterium]
MHATAKIVLLGESGVGKTGLGWRLAKEEFREHSSSHGEQFWVLANLKHARSDGVSCEAVLWDLAGQPDYRIIHSLSVEDADLALVLFDPTDPSDPLAQSEYWLKTFTRRLRAETPMILVGARMDRGALTVTEKEVASHCQRWGVAGGYVATSALDGTGVAELLDRMRRTVRWDHIVATSTTSVFHAIKQHVLSLKESADYSQLLVSFHALGRQLAIDIEPSTVEISTAVDRLAKHGYVRVLATRDEPVVLLRPEVINNLSASFVLEARRNPEGLGALVEERVIAGDYPFPELGDLPEEDQAILLRAVVDLLLRHTICLAETTATSTYLIFPELINVRRSRDADANRLEDVSYRVRGATPNLYASLVVLLGYTGLFSRAEHWHRNAEYSYRDGGVCGFTLMEDRDGELNFVLYVSPETDATALNLFRSLVERILTSKGVDFSRYPRVHCEHCGEGQERAVIITRIDNRETQMFCANCGSRIALQRAAAHLAAAPLADTAALQRRAARRAVFEQALAAVRAEVAAENPPSCFISYAWDDTPTTEWVREQFAPDLRHAGIVVVLDRWGTKFGDNIARWIENELFRSDYVIPVCTPMYRSKYDSGSVLGAEVDLINA